MLIVGNHHLFAIPLLGKSLRLEPDVLPVGRDEEAPGGFGRDMADDVDHPQPYDLLLHGERHGEEQFVVLAAVERRDDRVGVHLLGQGRGLFGDGNPLQVDAGAAFRGAAEL